MEIPIFNTYIDPSASEHVNNVLKTTFLSEGKIVKEFEGLLSSHLGWTNPVTVNSGTSALHLALILAGVKPGDEVILPAQTFVATGLAILYCGAIPVFADIQYNTGNINPEDVTRRITSKTKAIICVDWGGMPCDMDELSIIAKTHNVKLIEDAAHAPGATYNNKNIGSIADITCFSFQAIKHITTGDGGALSFLDPQIAKRALIYRWFGIDRINSTPSILGERDYDIKEPGYKYHLNDYAAALGVANLTTFNTRLQRRRDLAALYRKLLSGVDGISLFSAPNDRTSAWWLFGLHVVDRREDFIRALKSRGITASVVHVGIDRNSIFGGKKNDIPNQRSFDASQIHIPIHDGITHEHIEYIVDTIRKGW